ncbi:histidine kinase [Paenibacillus sp. J5C_2022]|uniref:sensor histidine kinase n=1 Tax=Paenibacillus sp. J5C2022 TaxID=2977129 RepID=UPI0021D3308E|nr:histidine kinase [Paenibacillus sp. J5C2022]MCU6711438.1 histidine kinase [Paenibacillus sp. J5C2022]
MRFIKGSLIFKIIISLLIATTIPFIVSNYISYQMTGKAIKTQLVELNQNSMSITMSTLHSYFHELSLLGLSYFNDPALVRLLSSTEPQTPAESVYISQRLAQIYANHNEIGSVSYKSALTNKQFNIRHHYNSKVTIPDFVDRELSYAHSELQRPFQVTHINKERRLRVNKPFIDISTREVIGLTTFEVKPSRIAEAVDSLATSEHGPIYVFLGSEMELLHSTLSGSDGRAVAWQSELKRILLQSPAADKGELKAPEGSYVYDREWQNGLELTIVKLIPQALINEARTSALNKTVAIQVVSIAFVSVLAAFIAYYMLRRIKHILQHIKMVQMGNFQLRRKPAPVTPDELDLLEIRFQEMAAELDELLNKQYRHQLELSQARLKMMQAQINPHFFYNTLQSIGTLAIKSNARDVSDRLAEFGALFRYTMDIESEDVLLIQEMEHVERYAALQQGRYKQRLTYRFHCPEEARQFRVPRMMLQPLVENSIVHGLERGNGHIHIIVQVAVWSDSLSIEVIDNGKGFTEEQIEWIKRSYAEHRTIITDKHGIGLSNVLKRLRLYYGASFGWSIASEPYARTNVTLQLPCQSTGGEEHEDADRR